MAALKAGIIGTGFMAAIHTESVNKSGLGEVIAISGPTDDKAKAKARELGIQRPYDDYMDLIRDNDIEVIHNCTPNSLHFPINRAILTANRHVISEKPLAIDSREARLLLGAAERSAAVNAVVFSYRYHPVVQELKALIQSGALGDIYSVHGSYLQDWLLFETDYSWRVDSDIGGSTRVVAELGSSWLDVAQYITGQRITEVVGDMKTFIPVRQKSVSTVGTFGESSTPRPVSVRVGTEDYASALVRFENGARGALTLSHVSAGRKNQLYIQVDGSKKSVAWDQEQPDSLWFGYKDRPNENPPKKGKPKVQAYDHFPAESGDAWGIGIDNFLQEVYKYIVAGKDPKRYPAPFTTFQDGYESVVLTDRILDSNRQGRWTKTGFVPE
jgi:predicted dehydrogenase